jgi:acetaldehyde dehydrogenase
MKKAAIIGTGNIGTDLLIKAMRTSKELEVVVFAGIDPASEGLAFAARHGIGTTHQGIEGLLAHKAFADVDVVFDATSARAHHVHAPQLLAAKKRTVDLTPAAVGPFVVPVVNLEEHRGAMNVNMVTCGGQATIPIVAAVHRVAPVRYAEIVASIASKSAGPGTRANIDEFTDTTSRGLEVIGGAKRGKAIIVLNPAEPPVIMRDTVYCLCDATDAAAVTASVRRMVADVQGYVPGYRLLKDPMFEAVDLAIPGEPRFVGHKVTVFLEVEGAGHHLPAYAGNLDIMTSAALRTGEVLVRG